MHKYCTKMVGKIIASVINFDALCFPYFPYPFKTFSYHLFSHFFFSSQVMVHVYKKRKPIYTVPSIS